MTQNLPAASVEDPLALQEEYTRLAADIQKCLELSKKLKDGQTLTPLEQELLDSEPSKCRRAVELTRILRKTHTGPAKVKSPKSRKALAKQQINDLLNGL